MDVTQRRVETFQGQQSPQYCSWLFPGLDLQVWATCPADTRRGNLFQCQAGERLTDTLGMSAVTWKTSVWLGLGCVCCSPVGWEWCWFCHWDHTSLGRPWNWVPLWLLSPDTSEDTIILLLFILLRVNFTKNVQAVKINASLPNAVLRFVSPE